MHWRIAAKQWFYDLRTTIANKSKSSSVTNSLIAKIVCLFVASTFLGACWCDGCCNGFVLLIAFSTWASQKIPPIQNSVIGQHRGGGLKGAKARNESRSESRSELGWIPWLVPHRSVVVAPSSSEQLLGPIPSLGWHLGAGRIKIVADQSCHQKLMKNHKY